MPVGSERGRVRMCDSDSAVMGKLRRWRSEQYWRCFVMPRLCKWADVMFSRGEEVTRLSPIK